MQFSTPNDYVSISWGQTKSSVNRVFIIQKRALRTTHFKDKFDHTSFLFSESNKIKFPEKIFIENCLFVSKSVRIQLPEILNNWFAFSSDHTDIKYDALKKVSLK